MLIRVRNISLSLLTLPLAILPYISLYYCYDVWFPITSNISKWLVYFAFFGYLSVVLGYTVIVFIVILPLLAHAISEHHDFIKIVPHAPWQERRIITIIILLLVLMISNIIAAGMLATPNFLWPVIRCGQDASLVTFKASGRDGSIENEHGNVLDFRTDAYGNWSEAACISSGVVELAVFDDFYSTCSIAINGFLVSAERDRWPVHCKVDVTSASQQYGFSRYLKKLFSRNKEYILTNE